MFSAWFVVAAVGAPAPVLVVVERGDALVDEAVRLGVGDGAAVLAPDVAKGHIDSAAAVGLACAATDTACLTKLGVAAGVSVVVAASGFDGADGAVVRVVDVDRGVVTGAARAAALAYVKDAAAAAWSGDVADRVFGPPATTVTTVTTAPPPTTTTTTTPPTATTPEASPLPAVLLVAGGAALAGGVVAGVVAVTDDAVAGSVAADVDFADKVAARDHGRAAVVVAGACVVAGLALGAASFVFSGAGP